MTPLEETSTAGRIEGVKSMIDLTCLSFEDVPPIAESDVSSDSDVSVSTVGSCTDFDNEKFTGHGVMKRDPLQWEFSGLTLWIELEEFENDLSLACKHMATQYGLQEIPKPHATAIYGMHHLSVDEAKARLRSVPDKIPLWPSFRRPVGVVQDIAVAGNPGQVCSIAWAQLTLASSPEHEGALDALYDIFYGPESTEKTERHRPWTPHSSIAYDNPEETVLSLPAALACIAEYPTLLSKERGVKGISLWNTEGKLADWKCLDRICFVK